MFLTARAGSYQLRFLFTKSESISIPRSVRPDIYDNLTAGDRHRRRCSHCAEWNWATRELVLPDPQRRINHTKIAHKMIRAHHVCERRPAGFADVLCRTQDSAHLILRWSPEIAQSSGVSHRRNCAIVICCVKRRQAEKIPGTHCRRAKPHMRRGFVVNDLFLDLPGVAHAENIDLDFRFQKREPFSCHDG